MKHLLTFVLAILCLWSQQAQAQLSKERVATLQTTLAKSLEKSNYKEVLTSSKLLSNHYKNSGEILSYLEVQSQIYLAMQALALDAEGFWQEEMKDAIVGFDAAAPTAIPSLDVIKETCTQPKALMNLLRLRMLDLAKQPDKAALGYALQVDKIAQYLLRQAPSQADKTFYLQQFWMVYNTAQDICYALYNSDKSNQSSYLDKGFYFAEQYKSMLLKDALKENEALHFGGIPDELRQQYQQLKIDLSDLYEQLATAKKRKKAEDTKINSLSDDIKGKLAQLESLEKRFEKEYPKFYQLKHDNSTIDIKTVQNKLVNDSTVFIEYVSGDAACYVYIISKTSVQWKQLPGRDSLNRVLAPFVADMITLKEDLIVSYSDKGYKVYQFLLEDILKQLPKTTKKLILVPDDKLHNLPFEALMTEPVTNPTTFEKLPYLLKKYSTSYTYSASLLLDNKGYKTVKNLMMLGVAGMYSDDLKAKSAGVRSGRTANIRAALDPLPFAKAEVELLQKVFDGKFLFENEANEGQFKKVAKDYAVIHLAMHGLADPNNPAFSGLAFTENLDSTEDNILYLDEINNLELNAQLVVLSACQTGIGKFQAGEGVVSVARSFMYAGAPSVIMTLWPVNDQATQMIMNDFYNFLKQGMSKDDALQAAKIKYLGGVKGLPAHPVLWAPYIQLGDSAPINIPQAAAIADNSSTNLLLWVSIGLIVLGLLLGIMLMRNRRKKS